MFCKDVIEASDMNIYRIYLCTIDGKGDRFIPAGKHADEKELKLIYAILTRPNAQLDIVVEGVKVQDAPPIFFITDTELTI
jgi:hypothetical protein